MKYCPGGGMADTLVLEASAERRESSSLSWGTIFRVYSLMVKQRTHNPLSLGSIPSGPTKEFLCSIML